MYRELRIVCAKWWNDCARYFCVLELTGVDATDTPSPPPPVPPSAAATAADVAAAAAADIVLSMDGSHCYWVIISVYYALSCMVAILSMASIANTIDTSDSFERTAWKRNVKTEQNNDISYNE